MFRSVSAFALLLSSTAFAHDHAHQTAQPPATPAAPQPSEAEANAAANAVLPPDQAAMKAHILFLASDQLKGREAGTPEYDVAAQYVASQFYAAGLRPAGDAGSYLQRVPLVSYKAAEKGTMSFQRRGGQAVPLVFGEDFVTGADPERAVTDITAPVVFVGYGIDAPEFGRNDYRGVDVKGKVVAFLDGAPAGIPSEPRAHLSRTGKMEAASKRGAIGAITLQTPESAKVRSIARLAESWDGVRMTWADGQGVGHSEAPGVTSLGTLGPAGAAKLFEGASTPWATIAARSADPKARFKAFQLPATATVRLKTTIAPATSYNVAGLLPGSDPKLKDEVVVLTAHLDHVGVGRADASGDTIYNGAMDNAVGIASLIEEAKRFKASGKPPRRSIMFLAVTAEEKGLVGADYFATNPTVPKANMVANVNLDMPIITYKFQDVVAFGADRSSLGPIVRRAAANIGVGAADDPLPEQSFFVRSDHYRFVQQGVPSVFLWPGPGGPGKEAWSTFLATNYHRPSDEVVQTAPIDWESGARFIEVNYQIAREIADADQRPVWNKGDFFGTLYKGPMAR
ncbi:M28 family metallopeptidase [Sphingomonas lenta]|nr:M28 family metallopeptidase [Sphingomonas lenta]